MQERQHLPLRHERGLTLIELMVAMAISLIIVVAAAYVYLASRESQRAIDRSSSSRETGAFIVQMLGRDIMNAGFYPANMVPVPGDATQTGMYDTYPPLPTLDASGNSAQTFGRPWRPMSSPGLPPPS